MRHEADERPIQHGVPGAQELGQVPQVTLGVEGDKSGQELADHAVLGILLEQGGPACA